MYLQRFFRCKPKCLHKCFDGQPAMEQYELRKAVDDCLAEDPVNGQCTVWAAKSGLGVMSEWNTGKFQIWTDYSKEGVDLMRIFQSGTFAMQKRCAKCL